MVFIVPNENVETKQSYGQAINKVLNEHIGPELKRLGIKDFTSAGIEFFDDGHCRVYVDEGMEMVIGFKKRKVSPDDTGKRLNLDLKDIKDVEWAGAGLQKESAKVFVIRFSKDWWIYGADFKKRKDLEESFKVTTTHKVRGSGYLPLEMLRQTKQLFVKEWKQGLEKELPLMWRRHVTVSQKYRGVMVYDGNYFDLFVHAQELYVLGYYYASVVVCRSAAEQALMSILLKSGKSFDIYYDRKPGKKAAMAKGIKDLVSACRDKDLFPVKFPITKVSESKLMEIAAIANDLVHLKSDLAELDAYKKDALRCMGNLFFVIKRHLNFVKDTGKVSGFRASGKAKRLK